MRLNIVKDAKARLKNSATKTSWILHRTSTKKTQSLSGKLQLK